jgi:DNA-binding CsgD family transcriptional regulator
VNDWLTVREAEVLRHMRDGRSYSEIGADLGIGYTTVRNHVTAIFRKLDVANGTQAVVKGIRLGYIPLNDDAPDVPLVAELIASGAHLLDSMRAFRDTIERAEAMVA